VSPEVRENLVRAEEELKKTRADIKLVEMENLHFTVKFLGDVPDSVLDEVDRRVRPLSLPRMEVDVRGIGAFPDDRSPRVVWAGVSYEDLDVVSKSAQTVIDALRGVGENDEREYHPHITLARVRSPTNIEALVALLGAYASKDFGRTPIMMLKLKSSTLTPRGPAYRDIKEYALK
jgi:RNA 2',3'-cyclic 3'-phosphodiesterase